MKIIKRSGQEIAFDITKIEDAIRKACEAVDVVYVRKAAAADRAARGLPPGTPNVRTAAELRLREAITDIVRHNRRIRDSVIDITPYYLGDPAASEPPTELLLESLLNPKINGADEYLTHFAEAAKAFKCGEYPKAEMKLLFDSSMHLIRNCLEPIGRVKEYNISITVLSAFHKYLTTPHPNLTEAEHAKNIDEHIQRLQRRFCGNSDAVYAKTTDEKCRRENDERHDSRRKPSTVRKRSRVGHHGTQTQRMGQQLKRFANFLKENPVCEFGSGKTLNARAKQFWQLNCNTFERAAAASGEKRGYSSYKALASAYRTSKT